MKDFLQFEGLRAHVSPSAPRFWACFMPDLEVSGAKKEAAAGHGRTRSVKIFLLFWPQPPKNGTKKPPAVPGIARQAAWVRPCFKGSFTLSGSVPGTRIF